jgi:cellulose biosynthesis protein BcsQ
MGDYDTFNLAKSVIRDRTIYHRSTGLGQEVIEFAEPNDKATQEIQQLYKEVFGNE